MYSRASINLPKNALKILIIEDDVDLMRVMSDILESDGFRVFTANTGPEALELFESQKPDLILSDIMMPDMDGYAVLQAVRAHPDGFGVPFLFVSALTERRDLSKARDLGADDFIFKPFGVDELRGAVRAKLDRRRIIELFDTRTAHLQTVTMLSNAIEARDTNTRGHVERVRRYALELARTLKWSADSLIILEFGAILHDIGKISVPEHVLNKTGPLNSNEWDIMKQHPAIGARMLEGVDHLKPALPYVLYHHERWDGSGYPHGTKGKAIPIEGRLLAIVDSYDAMTTSRPYHNGLMREEALNEIRLGMGVQFDPDMATVFLKTQAVNELIP